MDLYNFLEINDQQFLEKERKIDLIELISKDVPELIFDLQQKSNNFIE